MNRISIYILLIFIYLGLSKSFSPSEKRAPLIKDHRAYPQFFKTSPVSVVLIDAFKTGFLIKTYFHKYLVLTAFKSPITISVRVSRKFFDVNSKNLGMSLFRRKEGPNTESTLPVPPGLMYVGDPFYGRWRYLDSGEKIWKFHRAYRHFKNLFGWLNFKVNYLFFKEVKKAIKNHIVYYGPSNQFGSTGVITSKFLEKHSNDKKNKKETLQEQTKNHLLKFISIPWKKGPEKKVQQ